MAVDLSKEPVSFSLFEDEQQGQLVFSDLPEQVVPSLIRAFGETAVANAISPSPTELEFYRELPVSERTRPRYLDLLDSGELERRVTALERQGLIERRVPYFMAAINRSDEPILGRTGGIYLVCKKGCLFCQYRTFPELELTAEAIAERMLALAEAGADNIQWISPVGHTRVLLKALWLAARAGLTLPIVHKGDGEDSASDLGLLDGAIDVYLPDAKFVSPEFAANVGLTPGYGKRLAEALRLMVAQVGPLTRLPGERLLAAGGVLVRHLIMPGGVDEARKVFELIDGIDPALPVHVMTTYQPLHDALSHPSINRRVTPEEIAQVANWAHEVELSRVYVR